MNLVRMILTLLVSGGFALKCAQTFKGNIVGTVLYQHMYGVCSVHKSANDDSLLYVWQAEGNYQSVWTE